MSPWPYMPPRPACNSQVAPVVDGPGLDDCVSPDPVARMEDALIDLTARVARLEVAVRDLAQNRGESR